METIISIENIKKKYILGSLRAETLYETIYFFWEKLRKEKNNRNIELNNKTKTKFYALNGINIKIKKGERLGIIGKNGAGKSTLLKILSRVTSPTNGRIIINGRISSMLEVGTGFDRELTGRENIYLNGAILGMSKKEVDEKIQSIIDFSECGTFIDTPVKRYSSGMYVKLAFAVAAHLDSEILIMDEVLAVGDIAFQKKCLDKMNQISESEDRTILYVSHNMNTIRALCNRAIVLDKGKKIFDGDVDTAISFYSNSIGERKSYRDFSQYTRNDRQTNYKAKIFSVEVLNNQNCIIPLGEHLHFLVKLKCFCNIPDIHFRIIINKMDGTPCGSTMSKGICDCNKNTEKTVELDFDSSVIAPGKYSATLILFHPDDYGSQEKFDMIENAMFFEVINSEGKLYNWQWPENWGSTVYPELKVKQN